MPDEFAYLKPTVERLQKQAEANGQQLQGSFVLRLENLLLNKGTRSLSNETKTKIAERVGMETIEQAGRSGGSRRLGGAVVEACLRGPSDDPFGNSYQAVRKVVQDHGSAEEMAILDNLDLGGD